MFYLVINSGSSSLKFKLFNEKLAVKHSGLVEKIGQTGSFIDFDDQKETFTCANHEQALNKVLFLLTKCGVKLSEIKKVGHRVVHGGEDFQLPMLVTKKNLKQLEKYNKLAPLHNPPNILGIKSCLNLLPQAKNYAVFDTAFHATLPAKVYIYPLPIALYKKFDIRRYGFHGLSHEFVAHEAAKKLKKPLAKLNLITCHLGSGSSMAAIKNGKVVDTTMGFSPLQGLMMSTRCGDIDASIPLFLQRHGYTVDQVDNLLNKESGFVGLTGFKDLRDVLSAAGYKVEGYENKKYSVKQKAYSELALSIFVDRVRKYIGAYFVELGKVDAIIFTAGIGERSAIVRNLIMKNLPIKTKAFVIPTNEELMIVKKIV